MLDLHETLGVSVFQSNGLSAIVARKATVAGYVVFLAALAGCMSAPGEDPVAGVGTPLAYVAAPSFDALSTLAGTGFRSFSSAEIEPYSHAEYPHGNKDFNNFVAVCGARPQLPWQHAVDPSACEPGRDGYLIASADGPGVISRIFFTSGPNAEHARGRVLEERLLVYIDDDPSPSYDAPLASWLDGAQAPFAAPDTSWTSGALVSYAAIPYRTKVRVFLDGLRDDSLYYYAVDLRDTVEPPPNPSGMAGEPLDVHGSFQIEPGAELTLFSHEGEGTLQLVELAFEHADPALLDELDLRMEWDELPAPALDLPIAFAFASSQELRAFSTRAMQVEVDADGTARFVMELPMPFRTRARVSLHNRSRFPQTLEARLSGSNRAPTGAWGHLHVQSREAIGPFTPEQRFAAAELDGRGKLVGIIMAMEGRGDPAGGTPHPVSFLEGDPILRVDGAVTMHGTGVEDFFNAGWYFQEGPFDQPSSALTSFGVDLTAATAHVTAVRWLLADNAVEYTQQLALQFEYGAFEPLIAHHYRSVAFYYADSALP